jgi:protein-S-isoprenylcysteine O-methyltransferase Ste14
LRLKRNTSDLLDVRIRELELKIPPGICMWLAAGGMWLLARATPSLTLAAPAVSLAAAPLVAAGLVLIAWARVHLARAGTTWSPIAPDRAATLVTDGPYRWSRNPIYLGLLLVLLGVVLFLRSPVALVLAAAFVAYEDRFQIQPEERALQAQFGKEFEQYMARTRRWA